MTITELLTFLLAGALYMASRSALAAAPSEEAIAAAMEALEEEGMEVTAAV